MIFFCFYIPNFHQSQFFFSCHLEVFDFIVWALVFLQYRRLISKSGKWHCAACIFLLLYLSLHFPWISNQSSIQIFLFYKSNPIPLHAFGFFFLPIFSSGFFLLDEIWNQILKENYQGYCRERCHMKWFNLKAALLEVDAYL